MSRYEKQQPTPFDKKPLEGLYFLDGDRLTCLYRGGWTTGLKYPLIVFPSGRGLPLWTAREKGQIGLVHLFGELQLPLAATRAEAFEIAKHIAARCGYGVARVGENQLEVWGSYPDDHLLVTYDNAARRMLDVELLPEP